MGQVMVPERLLEIVQQNNEKAYPQIIMDEASYPYLFYLSDIRQMERWVGGCWRARKM